MDDPYERRALLLHLGDVLECLFCVSKAGTHANVGDALAKEDSLAGFTLLTQVDAAMTLQAFIERASGAFFGWPKALLDEQLNRDVLASTVQHDLFDGNTAGWSAYVKERRASVPWFGEGLAEKATALDDAFKAEAATAVPVTTVTKTGKVKTMPTDDKAKHQPRHADKQSHVQKATGETEASRYATWPWPDTSKGS